MCVKILLLILILHSVLQVEGINRLAIDTSRKPAVDVSESSSDGDLDDDDDDEDLFEVDDVEEDDIKRQQRVGSYEVNVG